MKHHNPPTLTTPRGYSHVVEATGGRTIYVSGQVALDKHGRVVGAGDMAAQTRQVFENLKLALGAADASLDDIVKITVFVTDVAQAPAVREVRDEYLTKAKPASSLVQITALFMPELLIEIEAVAVVGG